MLREIVSLSFLFLIYRTNEAQQNQNWDLNWPCQAHIKVSNNLTVLGEAA